MAFSDREGCSVTCQSIYDFKGENGPYDCIYFSGSLMIMPDPVAALVHVQSLLRPRGIVSHLFQVPIDLAATTNLATLLARLYIHHADNRRRKDAQTVAGAVETSSKVFDYN